MSTPHIHANPGDIADFVLMPGDPLRAKLIAENFLENAALINDVRGMLGYTGTYKNRRLSVMASGMGMPSIGIYSYELFTHYDVQTILRIGSAGSYVEELALNDIVLASASCTDSSYAEVMGGKKADKAYPSAELNDAILKASRKTNISCTPSTVYSGDVFYILNPNFDYHSMVKDHGCTCTEMESFALFWNAAQLGKKAGCLLTISDSFVSNAKLSAEDRQNSFSRMIHLALEASLL